MVWTNLYISIGWHIAICAVGLIWGIGAIISSDEDKWQGIIVTSIAIIYFLFAPYSHEEQIRNCRTKNGNEISVDVKFKEPIVKLIFIEPRDVKIMSIDGREQELELIKSPRMEVADKESKLTVFEGKFEDKNGASNTLYLLL